MGGLDVRVGVLAVARQRHDVIDVEGERVHILATDPADAVVQFKDDERLDVLNDRRAGYPCSTLGCVWQLGRTHNHTAGCLLLHGHALTWRELRAAGFIPPLHLRCDCDLHVLPDNAPAPSPARTLVLIAEAKRLEADE